MPGALRTDEQSFEGQIKLLQTARAADMPTLAVGKAMHTMAAEFCMPHSPSPSQLSAQFD